MRTQEAVSRYLEALAHTRRKSTVNRANQILKNFVIEFRNKPLESFSSSDISGYISRLPHCARTRANHHVRVIALLRFHGNTLKVPAPRYVEKEPETYEERDLKAFFSACDIWQTALFRVLLSTGLRMQEVKYLEWKDIRNGSVLIREKPEWGFIPKTCEERRIPIAQSALTVLNQMPRRPGTLVFPTKKGKPDKHLLRTCKRVAQRAGLDAAAWCLHGFRRTFCTTILRDGVDVRTTMKLMGHASMESTLRYWRPLEAEQLRSRLGKLFT